MQGVLKKIEKIFGVDLNPKNAKGKHFLGVLLVTAFVSAVVVIILSPWLALALTIGLIFLGFALFKPELILMFLLVYTPFEPFLLKFVPDDMYLFARYFSEGLIYVLLVSVAIRIFTKKKKIVSSPIDLPFIFLILIALTSLVINAVPPFIGILGLRQIIRFILLFFIILYLNPKEAFIKKVTALMFAIVLFQGLLGITQAFVGAPLDEFLIPSERKFYESIQLTSGTNQFWSPGSRVFATMGRFDQLGTFLSFFFLIGAGLLYSLKDKEKKKTLGWIIAFAFPGFIMTLSRASWFGLILGMIVIGVWLMRDMRLRLFLVSGVILAVSYVAFSGLAVRYLVDYADQTPVERFFEAFSYERWRGEYLGLGRLYWIVQTPTQVVSSSPLFGVGPGQYGGGAAAALGNSTVYEKLGLPFGVYGTEGYIDNNWFSIWGELGTLGLIFFAWMILALARMSYETWLQTDNRFTRGLALGYLGAVVAVSFQAFLATYFEVRTLAIYLWVYGAFVYVLARQEKLVK